VLWFAVWTVLVLATLAGALWLGRDLWRKGRALLAELEHAAAVVELMADRAEELTAAAQTAPPSHDLLADPAEAHARLRELGVRRGARRAERHARHAVTHARWRAYSR
jgi:hypothetical protein